MGIRRFVHNLPWDVIKWGYQHIRHVHFTVSGGGPSIEVEGDLDDFEEWLCNHHFSPWDKFAYVYEGEDLNMRRIEEMDRLTVGDDLSELQEEVVEALDAEEGEEVFIYWQTHVRVFDQGDGTLKIKPHYELCPIQHPAAHIDEEGLHFNTGIDTMNELLEDSSFPVVE